MKRLLSIVLLTACVPHAFGDEPKKADEETAAEAVAAIEKLGGKAERDDFGTIAFVDLSECDITDATLAHLKSFPDLRELNLSETKIGDKGLAHLRELSKLQILSLYKTNVTDAGIAHLKAIPD